jgi:uncharacterized membrane protein
MLRLSADFVRRLKVLFGYDQGVFSGIVGNADFLDTFGYVPQITESMLRISADLMPRS